MAFVGRLSARQTIDGYRDHVSSGKVELLTRLGLDFVPGRREGISLWDVTGERRLIDCHCNGGVFNLGHRHPVVVDTLKRALDELDIGPHSLLSEQQAVLARRLAELAPGELPYTVFASGGGEAIDFAVKLARAYSRRPGIVSACGGYHNHTGLAPGVVPVPFGDLAAAEAQVSGETAAILVETVPVLLGMPIAPLEYFAGLRALCDRHGALLIVDEVHSGLGRSGKLWAIEHWRNPTGAGHYLTPDILVMGEGLGGGIYPIAATCFRAELDAFMRADSFDPSSTFGGAEIGCAAALAVLELTAGPAFLRHVRELADRLGDGLAFLQARYPAMLLEVRQLGLMIGLVLPDDACAPRLSALLGQEGVLAMHANSDRRVLPLLPPLIMGHVDAEEVLGALDRALKALEGQRREAG